MDPIISAWRVEDTAVQALGHFSTPCFRVLGWPVELRQEEAVRIFSRFWMMGVLVAAGLAAQTRPMPAQAQAPVHPTTMQPAARPVEPADNPVADPKAIVTIGNARFTVLTPQLIRMEWSATGKFEDHASLVFINRRLPVPKYTTNIANLSSVRVLEIKTEALSLHYVITDGEAVDETAFGPENLNIAVPMGDGNATWRPGQTDYANLQGTTRTLDQARGSKTQQPIEPGLISREGWTLVDDSTRPLFDSTDFRFLKGEKSPWPWAMERPASEAPGKYQDWYFFGYGHDYKQALGDFV